MIYTVYLKSSEIPVTIDADKFNCESGNTIFYKRPAEKEPFEEVKRFISTTVRAVEER
jgi:hypothetical protein